MPASLALNFLVVAACLCFCAPYSRASLAGLYVPTFACNVYQSPSSGEPDDPNWGNKAFLKASPAQNKTNPFMICYTALATYTYADNSSKGFALMGGIPTLDMTWYNGVGGMLLGLIQQPDLHQYVYDYCRNSMAGNVVTAPVPSSVLASMSLNLDGGVIVNGSYVRPFPSYVSYIADQTFLVANPGPVNATVRTWCCDWDKCNTAVEPVPAPPAPPTAPLPLASSRTSAMSATAACAWVLLLSATLLFLQL